MSASHTTVTTSIPQRMDRLPWSRWHWLVVTALGVTWILDGLEVSIVAALGPVLTLSTTLNLTASEVGLTASAYLTGSVVGAIVFSYLTDRQGRKKWFMFTLLLYLAATVLTAFSWNLWSFMFFRFLTGAGIGGEYAAINSAIDELIPARTRGHTDLAINGSWWLGTAAGALLTIVLLNPLLIPEYLGWRLCFGFGAVLGVSILLVRRVVPESPRWLMTHGKVKEADEVVAEIEAQILRDGGHTALPQVEGSITVHARPHATLATVARELFTTYPRRTTLGIVLMVTQSFMYNVPFAIGNFLGPLLLGRFFDTIGRKQMISFTYAMAGCLLAVTGYLFWQGAFSSVTQMVAWSTIFFFASAGASAAYLTVSEIFPMEIRAMAIAFFFVVAQGAGIVAPWLYGKLIETSAESVFYGYLLGAGMMLVGAVVELWLGVKAEGRSLEHIATPLSAQPLRDAAPRA
jgi:MFS family permease